MTREVDAPPVSQGVVLGRPDHGAIGSVPGVFPGLRLRLLGRDDRAHYRDYDQDREQDSRDADVEAVPARLRGERRVNRRGGRRRRWLACWAWRACRAWWRRCGPRWGRRPGLVVRGAPGGVEQRFRRTAHFDELPGRIRIVA